ncbi:MAG TPA: hypothetical protein VD704_14250 [Gaiellaceae bacterium]|nr:hypothetical protein [Gaiellaceae bacterium]
MARLRALTFLVVLLAVAGCGGGSAGEGAGAGSTAAPGEAVAVEGETLDGGRLSLADLRGQPVFVNVWASW